MHALLAHAYHLLLSMIHLAERPGWRPPAACLAIAVAARSAGLVRQRGATVVGAVAVLAGWALLAPALAWPPPPLARLAGLGAILLGEALLGASGRERRGARIVTAALAAWWLRGAPFDWAGVALCGPVFLGLASGFAAAGRLSRGDMGWGTLAAALSLAASLSLAGAAPHWAQAAMLPAGAALALLGIPEAMPILARLVVVLAGSALVASDRGRLLAVDMACLTPLLAWAMSARLLRRRGRTRPVLAVGLTILAGLALTWAASRP